MKTRIIPPAAAAALLIVTLVPNPNDLEEDRAKRKEPPRSETNTKRKVTVNPTIEKEVKRHGLMEKTKKT